MIELLAVALFHVSLLNLQLNPPIPIDSYLADLEQCENKGKDITILDTDGYYSYGFFQFHKKTFEDFGELYGLPHDNIHSRVEQYEIAKMMLLNGLWRQWYNCLKNTPLADQDT